MEQATIRKWLLIRVRLPERLIPPEIQLIIKLLTWVQELKLNS